VIPLRQSSPISILMVAVLSAATPGDAWGQTNARATVTGTTLTPARRVFFQYGIGASAEVVADAGAMCDTREQCVLGSGGGVNAHVGLTFNRLLYGGLTYSVSKQDPAKLYRLATLQQFRVDGRRVFDTGKRLRPLVQAGVGVLGYGGEWALETWGPIATIGAGMEMELSSRVSAYLTLSYRIARTLRFEAPAGLSRGPSTVQIVALEFALDGRSELE
jgi:hypothetical protein